MTELPERLKALIGRLPDDPGAKGDVLESLLELAPLLLKPDDLRHTLGREIRDSRRAPDIPLERITTPFLAGLRATAGTDFTQRAEKKLDQLLLHRATPIPHVQGGHIVWRSRYGARKHLLKLPEHQAGERIWLRAKSVAAWQGAKIHGLDGVCFGSCDLASFLKDDLPLQRVESTQLLEPAHWDHELVVVPTSVLFELSAEESQEFERIATQEAVRALVVLWCEERFPLPRLASAARFIWLAESERVAEKLGPPAAGVSLSVLNLFLPLANPISDAPTPGRVLEVDRPAPGEPDALPSLPRARTTKHAVPPLEESRNLAASGLDCVPSVVLLNQVGNADADVLRRVGVAMASGSIPVLGAGDPNQLPSPWSHAPWLLAGASPPLHPSALTPRAAQLARRFAHEHLSPRAAARRLLTLASAPAIISRRPLVSVLCVSNRPELLPSCLDAYRRQTYARKELVLVVNSDTPFSPAHALAIEQLADVTLLRTPADTSLGESLNRARAVAGGELWTKMDDDDHYGANYLRDLVSASEQSRAAVCGKGTFFSFLESTGELYLTPEAPENAFSDRYVHGGTILANRKAVEGIDFPPVKRGTDTLFLQQSKLAGLAVYSADRHNFAYIRYAAPGHHTFDVGNKRYLRGSQRMAQSLDLELIDV